jgi:hypothetical protein
LVNEVEISLGRLEGRLFVLIEGAGRVGDRPPVFPIASEVKLEGGVSASPSGD